MTVFGFAAESSTYILLAPSLAWAVMEARLDRSGRWLSGGLLVSYGLFLAAEVAVWFPIGRQFHSLGPHPLAALLLLICLLIAERRRLLGNRAAVEWEDSIPAQAA